ncbi:MAG: hypothetical protein JWN11_748 [Hyphomicrobiales bacterium]|nr:hypothetical protein [Hyphomicrobiales bacterium]
MNAIMDRHLEIANFARVSNWRGRSGRLYALVASALDDFNLSGSELYVIAKENRVQWVGSAIDLVEDHASRARFRRALADADAVFHVPNPAGEVERMTLIWDLEAATPFNGLTVSH